MISTSYIVTTAKEPDLAYECVCSILNSYTYPPASIDSNSDYEILVIAPDEPTHTKLGPLNINRVQDPGQGKVTALNIGISLAKGNILIFTDGDCFLHNPAHMLYLFNNPKIGVVTGRVMPKEPLTDKWSFFHHFLLSAAHKERLKRFSHWEFIEASAYFMGIRKELLVNGFPHDVAEDSWISSIAFQKGYFVGYAHDSLVYVKGPSNKEDWIKQKSRCILSHVKQKGPRMKSFKNEIFTGINFAFREYEYTNKKQPLFWLPQLFLLRLYVWIKVKIMVMRGAVYKEGWSTVESTKR